MTREDALKWRDRVRYNCLNGLEKEAVDIAFDALRERESLVKKASDSGWISVEERLPEPNRVVLVRRMPVLGGNGYTAIDHVLAGFHYDGTWFEDLHTWKSRVTHWMPMPEPPEVEV